MHHRECLEAQSLTQSSYARILLLSGSKNPEESEFSEGWEVGRRHFSFKNLRAHHKLKATTAHGDGVHTCSSYTLTCGVAM